MPQVQYVALGHVHRPQRVPGSAVPARYAGSLLQLDFGEKEQKKSVAVIELAPGKPAAVREIPISAGRQLLDVIGTMEELAAYRTIKDSAFLRATLKCDGTREPAWRTKSAAACATSARETKTLVDLTKAITTAEQDVDRLGRALAAAASELENAKARDAAVRVAEEAFREQADRIDQAVRQARERAEAERNVSSLTAESGRCTTNLRPDVRR